MPDQVQHLQRGLKRFFGTVVSAMSWLLSFVARLVTKAFGLREAPANERSASRPANRSQAEPVGVSELTLPDGPLLEADARVYAIGDVHGRADLLERLLDKIEADISGFEGTAHLVFLGDYIDRGLQSRQVIEILLSDRLKPFEAYFLKGNHEDALLSFLSDPGFGPKWAAYGGRETLVSYGVRPPRSLSLNSEWEKAHDAFLKAIPNVHQKFLMTLPTSVRIGGYGFAHAGLRPGKTFAEQNDEDLMWIRDEFLGGKSTFDVMVVHGHTPVDQPHSDHRRINVDTGAYFTGRLTAAKLTGTTVEFIATDT